MATWSRIGREGGDSHAHIHNHTQTTRKQHANNTQTTHNYTQLHTTTTPPHRHQALLDELHRALVVVGARPHSRAFLVELVLRVLGLLECRATPVGGGPGVRGVSGGQRKRVTTVRCFGGPARRGGLFAGRGVCRVPPPPLTTTMTHTHSPTHTHHYVRPTNARPPF